MKNTNTAILVSMAITIALFFSLSSCYHLTKWDLLSGDCKYLTKDQYKRSSDNFYAKIAFNNEGAEYYNYGFSQDWIAAGFTEPIKACLWGNTLENDYFDKYLNNYLDSAYTSYNEFSKLIVSAAVSWKKEGFNPSTAREWLQNGFTNSTIAAEWRNSGFTPNEARDWCDMGRDGMCNLYSLNEAITYVTYVKEGYESSTDVHLHKLKEMYGCEGEISYGSFIENANPYVYDNYKGYCVKVAVSLLQWISKDEGLFKIQGTGAVLYIKFNNTPILDMGWYTGMTKIIGTYSYTTVISANQVVPALEALQ